MQKRAGSSLHDRNDDLSGAIREQTIASRSTFKNLSGAFLQ
jgi:hypothetical protein